MICGQESLRLGEENMQQIREKLSKHELKKIQEIELEVAKDEEGTFSINGDTLLRTLTLSGFKEIVIRGCPNLKSLTITDTYNVCEKIILGIPDYTPAENETREVIQEVSSRFNGDVDYNTLPAKSSGKEKASGLALQISLRQGCSSCSICRSAACRRTRPPIC